MCFNLKIYLLVVICVLNMFYYSNIAFIIDCQCIDCQSNIAKYSNKAKFVISGLSDASG